MNQKQRDKCLKVLPQKPGVYLFYDKNNRIIYIGKAANLKNRVQQYFQKGDLLTSTKYSMVKKIVKIKHEVCDSEIEALLLEANLIKKYQPEYNVLMKDDKSYVYIKITTEDEWPTVIKTKQIDARGRYFGPFTSGLAVKETLKLLGKIYPFRKCKMEKGRVCLFGRLGQCPCNGTINQAEYQKMIKEIILFFEGKKKKILLDLKKELKDWQHRSGAKFCAADQGVSKKQNAKFCASIGDINEKIEKIKWKILNLEKVLAHKQVLGLEDKIDHDLGELARELSLKKVPERIEGYDISHIFGEQAVGSMVVFQNCRPEKSEYRRFKIRSVKGIDDVGMLKEVLERRFSRVLNKRPKQDPNKTQKKITGSKLGQIESANKDSWTLPDLIIVDGGQGQLNVVKKVLEEYNLDMPVISLAKRLEEVYVPGEIKARVLRRNSPALHLIQRVRDEAHRFAVGYHRLLRRKKWQNK